MQSIALKAATVALLSGTVAAGGYAVAADVADVIKPTTDFSKAEKYEAMQGGAGTSRKRVNANAFSNPAHNLTNRQRMDFAVGNGFFKRIWVSAPASTAAADGLGPLFNAKSCQQCHLKDGRGHPPAANYPEDTAVSMFLRLSIPPQTDADRRALADRRWTVVPDPTYGAQLQDFAIQGHAPEGRMHIAHSEETATLADGTVISLRRPSYRVTDLGYGPLHPDAMLSPRVAPQMIGLGLLEMIPEEAILANADPDDIDGDGISGRPNRVWNGEAGAAALGRFGLKAGNPTVRQQSAEAFAGDIGISNPAAPYHWGECTPTQTACRAATHGDSPQYDDLEADGQILELVVFYARNLAVPKRRDVNDPEVLEGKRLFYESGCIACHVPKYVTATDPDRPEHSRQLIWPYTDLLLHDMGEGLADGRPEGAATGREWRTPPLWGIGLTEAVNGHTRFLHDGRARSLLEAILWHDGEARAARQRVAAMSKAGRDALLAFLNSL